MKIIAAVLSVALLPIIVFAQAYSPSQGVGGLFNFVGVVFNRIVPLLISLAVIYFIWQVFQYTIAGDEDKRKAAKSGIIYGVVGIFIMVSIWGLVAILQSTFGTAGVTSTIGNQLPQI